MPFSVLAESKSGKFTDLTMIEEDWMINLMQMTAVVGEA
jgi:hypothetical protein